MRFLWPKRIYEGKWNHGVLGVTFYGMKRHQLAAEGSHFVWLTRDFTRVFRKSCCFFSGGTLALRYFFGYIVASKVSTMINMVKKCHKILWNICWQIFTPEVQVMEYHLWFFLYFRHMSVRSKMTNIILFSMRSHGVLKFLKNFLNF